MATNALRGNFCYQAITLKTPVSECYGDFRKLSKFGVDWEKLLQILSGLGHIFRFPQIAPVVFIRAESQNLLAPCSEPQVGGDDRKRSFLAHHCKKPMRNYVNSAKSQRVHPL